MPAILASKLAPVNMLADIQCWGASVLSVKANQDVFVQVCKMLTGRPAELCWTSAIIWLLVT